MKLFNRHWPLIIVFLISLLPLADLLIPGLPVTHDGKDHVARIANFYLSLSEGNLIPRWAANLNWGFGHPILMFLYPLPSYSASLFHFLGFSLVDSVKIVFGLSFVLSGLSMYLWARSVYGAIPGVVASTLYLFAPYRFIDLYVRGAIGEHVAFVFPPLILYFIYKIKTAKEPLLFIIGLALSMAGLILAHNAISIMFLPFIVFYVVYLYLDKKNLARLVLSLFSIGYGFLLSAFFWIPAFIEGKYTLRDIVTGEEALKRFVSFSDLFWSQWNYGGTGSFSVQVGILQWAFVFLAPFAIYLLYKKKKGSIFYIATLGYFLGSIFIMLAISEPVWRLVTTLQKFQFPWRFLSVSVFASAVLGGLFVSTINNRKYQIILMSSVLVFSLVLTFGYWNAQGFLNKPPDYYSGIYESTTDTGESAPIWSVRFMERRPAAKMQVIEGDAEIKEIGRTSTKHSYIIDSKNSSRLVENTLYFPGWKVYVDGEEYRGVQFQDPEYRGLMTLKIINGEHRVDVVFEETKLRKIADIISLASLILIGVIFILKMYKKVKIP